MGLPFYYRPICIACYTFGNMKTKQLNLRVDPETKEMLVMASVATGYSQAAIVREAIDDWVDHRPSLKDRIANLLNPICEKQEINR